MTGPHVSYPPVRASLSLLKTINSEHEPLFCALASKSPDTHPKMPTAARRADTQNTLSSFTGEWLAPKERAAASTPPVPLQEISSSKRKER
eukprot:scaffold239336_cov24-Tisochrysis_lutea.AAC.2